MTLIKEKFYIIEPKPAVNLVANPSFEKNLNGYTGSNATILGEQNKSRRSAQCAKVQPSSGVTASVRYSISLTGGKTYTFSIDVLDVLNQTFQIYFGDAGGTKVSDVTIWTGDGHWKRKSIDYTPSTTGTYTLCLVRNSVVSTAYFYFDGVQCEEGEETTYFDGDSIGQTTAKDYGWNGERHASTSYRTGNARNGGTPLDIEDYASIISHEGLGMITQSHFASDINADGLFYQDTKLMPRDFVLTLEFSGTPADIIADRKALLAALAPDKSAVRQPVVIRYVGVDANSEWATEPLDIACHYMGGLERSAVNFGYEICAVQFRAFDPVLQMDGNDAVAVSNNQTVSNFKYIGYRDANGVWKAMGSGMNSAINTLTIGLDGTLYAGGNFTTAGGVTVNRIAKWNGTDWSALGTGMSGTVNTLTIGLDGSLYAGGNFTTAGGVTVNRIAKWNGTDWSALGTGMNERINALAIGLDGTLYAGGNFTTAGGITANYIAKWDGTSWSALGNGTSHSVHDLVIGLDGTLYAGGYFTTAGGVTVNRIAKWNGTDWSALGIGVNGLVYALAIGLDGSLYAGGTFTKTGNIELPDRMAAWNGSTWLPIDVDVNDAAANVYAILTRDNGELYIGGSWTSTSAQAASTAIAQNNGGASAYPIFDIKGPGTLWQIKNYTNGDAIYFRNLTLSSNEIARLVCDPRRFRLILPARLANGAAYILPGSSNLSLIAGDNNLSVFMTDTDTNSYIRLYWKPGYISIDEALR